MFRKKYNYCTILFLLLFASAFPQSGKKIGLSFNNFSNTGAKNQYASFAQRFPQSLAVSFEADTTFNVFDINTTNLKRLLSRSQNDSMKSGLNVNDLYFVVDTTAEIRKMLINNNINYFITGSFSSYEDKISISIVPMAVKKNYFIPMKEISSEYINYSKIYSTLNEMSQRLRSMIQFDTQGEGKITFGILCPISQDAKGEKMEELLSAISSSLPDELPQFAALSAYTFVPYEKTKLVCDKPYNEVLSASDPKLEAALRFSCQQIAPDTSIITFNFVAENFNENAPIKIQQFKVSVSDLYQTSYRVYSAVADFLQAAIKKDSTWDYDFLNYIKENNRNKFIWAGKEYVKVENWAAASVCFSKVLDIEDRNVEVLNALAMVDFKRNYFSDAQIFYTRSLAIDSMQNSDALAGLGSVNIQLGDFFRANNIFITLKKNNPGYKDINLLIGKSYLYMDSTKQAKEYLKISIIDNNDCFDCYYLLGVVNDNLDNYNEAITYYKKAIAIAPLKTEAENRLSSLLYRMGNFYFYTKEFEKALLCYHQSDKVLRTEEGLNQLRFSYNNLAQYTKADSIVNLLIDNKYYSADSIYFIQASNLSAMLDSTGNPYPPAILKSNEYLKKCESLNTKLGRLVTLFGVNYYNLNDTENTLKYYKQALKYDTADVFTYVYSHLNLAEFLITFSDTAKVREALLYSERAIQKLKNSEAASKQLNNEDELVAYYLSAMAMKILENKKDIRIAAYDKHVDELYQNVGLIRIWSFTTFYNFLNSPKCIYPSAKKKYLIKRTEKLKADSAPVF